MAAEDEENTRRGEIEETGVGTVVEIEGEIRTDSRTVRQYGDTILHVPILHVDMDVIAMIGGKGSLRAGPLDGLMVTEIENENENGKGKEIGREGTGTIEGETTGVILDGRIVGTVERSSRADENRGGREGINVEERSSLSLLLCVVNGRFFHHT